MTDLKDCLPDIFTPLPSTQYKIDRTNEAFAQNIDRPESKSWGKNAIDVDIRV